MENENAKIIEELVERARKAQSLIDDYTQEQIDDVCLSVGWQVYNDENIARLARMAVDETGMGIYEDKVKKHKNKVMGVLRDIKGAKTVGIIEQDEAKGITKYAKPVGVIGALAPVTNPTATASSNAISILKGRNAVIFAPHPKAKGCSRMAVEFMRQGLARVGAPEDLIQVIEEPSIELTGELMKHVDLVLATGGGAMVKAAYSSGTPAYGVGPGNSVQIIAEDADIEDATTKISQSKTFDHATACSSENSVIIHERIYDRAMEGFIRNGGFLCQGSDRKRLEQWMWVPDKKGHVGLNPRIIAQSAAKIAADAGITVPQGTTMLLVEGSHPLEKDRFAQEKLSPVLTLWKYSSFAECMTVLRRLTDNAGRGHSCGIHTFNPEYIDYLGRNMKTSRILVRQPQAFGNGGYFFNGMPSTTTLGCGTWGGNITSENIYYKHFINVTWVSEPTANNRPTDEEMWGGFWKKYGKGGGQ